MKVTAQQIRRLREETGAGMMAIKSALEKAKGKAAKAKEILKKQGLEKIAKRDEKQASEGQVYAYTHAGNRVAAVVKVNCETDFVANSDEFSQLVKELALQIASMEPKNIKELLKQAYIRDPKRKIQDLVDEVAAKVKEKVVVTEIARISL